MFPKGAICPAGLCRADVLCQSCPERAFAGQVADLTGSGEGSAAWSRQEPGTNPISGQAVFSRLPARVRDGCTHMSRMTTKLPYLWLIVVVGIILMVLQLVVFHCLTYVKVQAEGMGACSRFRSIFGC